jgi:hypothetical protein
MESIVWFIILPLAFYAIWIIIGAITLTHLNTKRRIDFLNGKWGKVTALNSILQLTFFPYTIYDCWIKK